MADFDWKVAKVPKINVVEMMAGGKGKIIDEKDFNAYKTKILSVVQVQQEKEASIAAKNELETLIVDLREKLSEESALKELDAAAEWMEEFDSLPAEKYKEKYELLQRLLEIKDEL